ncbi:MAG: phosphatidate cytidylyltransferase, partial [Acidimicrobiia bacterium]|nr:phosphatidate cytidylyltransferase [Acidimicrobiia bacterium]
LQRLFSRRFQGLGLAVDVGAGLGETDLVRVVRLAAATPNEDLAGGAPQPEVAPRQPEGPQAVEIPEFGIQGSLPVDFGGDDDGWVPEPDDAAYGWLDDDEGVPEWDNAPEAMNETPPPGEHDPEPSPPVADEVSDATPVVPVHDAAEPENDYDLLFGDTAVDDGLEEDPAWEGPEPDFSGFTAERYVSSSTAEHVGLADAIAQAATREPTELMALSADIPGLERGLVGLEDMDDLDSTGETVERTASDLPARVATGLGLVALVILGLWSGSLGLGALIAVVMGIAASEYYVSLRKTGLEPLTVIGLLGTAVALVGSAVWGLVTIPVAILMTAVAALIALTVMPERSRPLVNVALTVLGVAWVGGLGGFAMDMLDATEFRWLILATVLVTALLDVGSYFIGRAFGTHPIAPAVSPKKTVEGLVGGIVVAILAGGVLGFLGPFDLASGLLLGVSIAVVAPLGDLAVSVIKRSIGIKDMSSILPGHGGMFDRLDAILFAVPTAWVVFKLTGLLG